jgi:Ca2+-binding RTX toxin-like protein
MVTIQESEAQGRLAQRESASFTPKRSLVRSQYRPPLLSLRERGPFLYQTKSSEFPVRGIKGAKSGRQMSGQRAALIRRAGVLIVLASLLGLLPGEPGLAGPTPLCGGEFVTIVGTPANDTITGTPEGDVIAALDGDDTIYADSGQDTICGGPGDDGVFGQLDDDFIFGEDGGDEIHAGEGMDIVVPGEGFDDIYLGRTPEEQDIVDFRDAESIFVDLKKGITRGQGRDVLHGKVLKIWGSPGPDVLLGRSGFEALYGLLGRDALRGRKGHDTLLGGVGVDTVDGGDGYDYCHGETKTRCEDS